MRLFNNKLLLLTLAAFCQFLTVGCQANLGAADEQLQPVYPEEFSLTMPRDSAWTAIKSEVESVVGAQVLANSDSEHVVSWVETIKDSDIQETYASISSPAPRSGQRNSGEIAGAVDPGAGTESEEVGDGGCAITTVYVWSVPGAASRFRIHRVYYGAMTQPALSRSRGLYENDFYHRICTRLKIEPQL